MPSGLDSPFGRNPPPYLLNVFAGAVFAGSDNVLEKRSEGEPVMRVRRDSDNAEQDFTAREIDDGAVEEFVGGGAGFLVVWYDQSGTGFDMSQPTAADQPQIV